MENSRGYLREDFRLFHLTDSRAMQVEPHYHEFDKITIYISGDVSYTVEGRHVSPKSWDVLFVGRGDVHGLTVGGGQSYERVILWIDTEFLDAHSDDCDLRRCFRLARQRGDCVLRLGATGRERLRRLVEELERTPGEDSFGSRLMGNVCFLRLLLELDRAMEGQRGEVSERDGKMDEIMDYISENLRGDLSIDAIAGQFYLSRYYLMHRFREVTGCTVHDYVRQKRLAAAARALEAGQKPSQAAESAGFADYSAFLRAFTKTYGVSPRQYVKADRWGGQANEE